MLNVLIADDESKVCQLIEKLVDWPSLGMQVVATAENGIEALETLEVFPVREAMMQLKNQMLAARDVSGHEILQMTKEVCNLYLFFTLSYDRAAKLKRQDENRPIRMVKQYIGEHYGESLTLDEVSAIAELSPAYLSTVFKKDTGMTFLEYLSKVRLCGLAGEVLLILAAGYRGADRKGSQNEIWLPFSVLCLAA